MTDVFTKQKRSEVMSRIRGHGNRDTEIAMIQILKKYHIKGWQRGKHLLGKPDFTFPTLKAVIFVDGCFWHACSKHYNIPKNNRKFWEKKLQANKARDKFVTRELRKQGWIVVRVWEHELKNQLKVANKILRALPQR